MQMSRRPGGDMTNVEPDTYCTASVCVRPYRGDDAQALAEAAQASLDELRRWVPWVHAGYDRDKARAWIEEQQRAWEQGEAYSFAIVEADTDCFLGGIGINRID